jgi:hypothetical protein
MMRPKFHKILETAVEEGVRYGYRRAHKHIENPTEGAIIDNVVEQVMNSLDEYFTFEDDETN